MSLDGVGIGAETRLHTPEDCEDLINGSLFLATGGGGDPKEGLRLLQDALAAGKQLAWIAPEAIDDDVLTLTPFGMGSVAPLTRKALREMEAAGLPLEQLGGPDNSMQVAVDELSQHLGRKVGGLVPAEIGGGNVARPLVTGARLGIPVVDGAYADRSVPDEMQTTPYLHGKESWPFVCVDRWGDVVLVKRAANPHMLERIGKKLAEAAFDGTTMVATALSGEEMKWVVVPGALSHALAIGRAIRDARHKGADPVDAALAASGGGWRLFQGEVTDKKWEDRDGYMFGTTSIRGTDAFEGQELKVWFKNENHMTWLNGKPWVCSPDLVTLVDPQTAVGMTNDAIKEGDAVAVVGIASAPLPRTERGLTNGGPRYYGFPVDYRPIEACVRDEASPAKPVPRSPDSEPGFAAGKGGRVLRTQYPAHEVKLREVGWLPVAGGDEEIYYEVSGNPHGKPVVFVHGGPGALAEESDRCWFDPEVYKIVTFHQRGCGKSKPSARNSDVPASRYKDLDVSTLVSDMETLREHLGIDTWQVFGGSWGSTLSLAYAQAHPDQVVGLVLRGIFLGSAKEHDEFFSGKLRSRLPDPEAWDIFEGHVAEEERREHGLMVAYRNLIIQDDPVAMGLWSLFESYVSYPERRTEIIEQMRALRDWSNPQGTSQAAANRTRDVEKLLSPEDRSKAIMESILFPKTAVECDLLDPKALARLKCPIYIVQGADDDVCPPRDAADPLWEALLAQRQPVHYRKVPGAGHDPHHPRMTHWLVTATDALART